MSGITINDLPGVPMPGSSGGAPQLVGGSAVVPISAQVDSRAHSRHGPHTPGVAPGASQ